MNSDRVHEAVEELHKVLKEECGKHAVSATVFISHAEYEFKVSTRTPDSLDIQGISMRNLIGEWIR